MIKTSIYITSSIPVSLSIIKEKTDWIRRTSFSFENGEEKIVLVEKCKDLEELEFTGVYVDIGYEFLTCLERQDFDYQLKIRNLTPINIMN
jgi:hypothetical protein